MSATLTDLRRARPHFLAPPWRDLCGKFHSHLTVQGSVAQRDTLAAVCRRHHAKATVIDLVGFDDRRQRDVMATRHHVDPAPEAVARIIDDLAAMSTDLETAGLPVLRAKIEHESEPSIETYSPQVYHEVHVKLLLDPEAHDAVMAWLADQAPTFGWRPSRNPFQRRTDGIVQFVNLRLYEGDRAAADVVVERIVAALEDRGLPILEVKRETAILDTHRALDAWWA